MIAAFISAIIGIILKHFLDRYSLKNKAFSENISHIINVEILEPFHKNIELSLYKLVVINKKSLKKK